MHPSPCIFPLLAAAPVYTAGAELVALVPEPCVPLAPEAPADAPVGEKEEAPLFPAEPCGPEAPEAAPDPDGLAGEEPGAEPLDPGALPGLEEPAPVELGETAVMTVPLMVIGAPPGVNVDEPIVTGALMVVVVTAPEGLEPP